MRIARNRLGLIAAVVVLGCAASAMANKLTDALAKMPAPVQETFKKVLGKNTLGGLAIELEDGKTIYEAEYVVKKVTYVFFVAEDGKLIEHGVEVGQFFLPEEVVAAVKKAQPTGKIEETSFMVGDGKSYFTLEVKAATGMHMLRIGADGQLISDKPSKEISEVDGDE